MPLVAAWPMLSLAGPSAQMGVAGRWAGALRSASPTSCSSPCSISLLTTSFQLMTPNTKSIVSPSDEKGIRMPR